MLSTTKTLFAVIPVSCCCTSKRLDIMLRDCVTYVHFGAEHHTGQNKPRLNTFEKRAADSLGLGHIGGCLYHLLTADGRVIITKHVKMFEKQFSGMDFFEKSTIVDESPEVVEFHDDVTKIKIRASNMLPYSIKKL